MALPVSPASTTDTQSAAASITDSRPQFLGHPAGLFLLFMVEMWERFSYYGMRALLVLYLTSPLTGMQKPPAGAVEGFNPGPGWTDSAASTLYGWYTGLAYLFPVLGGIIADKLIGTHRSMIVGGILIMLGHIALAVSGMGSFHATHLGESIFIFGLAVIILGTGHFKPSVSVMVGQLYAKGDPRRDGAFSIFYMGINLGAFLCAFVCGTLGERVGWHWGFGSAAVGMLLGLITYSIGRPRFLRGIGEPGWDDSKAGKEQPIDYAAPPLVVAERRLATKVTLLCGVVGLMLSLIFAFAFHHGAIAKAGSLMTPRVAVAVGALVFIAAVWFVAIQRPGDKGPTASIFIFMLFNSCFWFAFEQAGSSITLYTNRYTETSINTTWFQSVNPLYIFIFAPVFAMIWTATGKRNLTPSQPVKIALGLILLGLGFVVLVMGARTIQVAPDGTVIKRASVLFVLLAYWFHTMGELCLSPTGLSYVTKAAPVRFVSLLMGIWFVSSFIANLAGGLVAAQVGNIKNGTIKLPWNLSEGTGEVQADFFMLFVVTSIGAGMLILILTPLLKMLMRNPKD